MLNYLFVLLLASCAKGPHLSPALPVQTEDTFTATFIAGQSPNQYAALLSWDTSLPEVRVLFRRESLGTLERMHVFEPQAKQWIDPSVKSGKTYTYELKGEQSSHSTSITIPSDFEVTGEMRGIENLTVQRVFLRKGASVILDGKPLSWTVGELISENATIQSFSAGVPAPANHNGRDGGQIKISAKKARGILTIIGNGETGGSGMEGPPGNPGQEGTSGNPATYECIHPSVSCYLYESLVAPLDPVWKTFYRCKTTPTDGGPGGTGATGGNGLNGKRGGNSSQISTEIADTAGFDLTIERMPGKGGLGGLGGKGGKGGAGGKAGLDPHAICPAKPGADGVDGRAGIPGERGEDGKLVD